MHSPQTEPAPYVGPVQQHQITPTKSQSFQSFSQHIPPQVKVAWGTIYSGGRLPPEQATRLFTELTTLARSSQNDINLGDILTLSDDSTSIPTFSYGDAVAKCFDSARSACDREQSRVNAEITALKRFRTTVKDLEVTTAHKQSATTSQKAVAYQGPPLSDIVEAFAETFCNVSHYEEDYGDRPLIGLAHELTPEVAKHIENGGIVSPQLQSVITTQTHQAIEQRKAFETKVNSEQEQLAEYQTQLEKADRQCAIACEDIYSFQRPRPADYTQVMPRLSRTKDTLTDVAASRQQDLLESHLGHDHNGLELISTEEEASTASIDNLQLQPATPLFETIYRQQDRLEPVLSETGRIASRVIRIENAVATLVSLRQRRYYPPHTTNLGQ